MGKPKESEGALWARATRQRRRECDTCAWAAGLPAATRARFNGFIADVIEERKANRTDASRDQLREELRARYSYPFSVGALGQHVRHSHGYDWPRLHLARG